MSSSHNNCRIIALFYEDEIQDTDHNPLCELNNLCSQKQKNCQSAAHEIVKAIESASEEFENTVLDDFTILVNTPNKGLPLLMGKITNKDAKKLYERLLKGASIK